MRFWRLTWAIGPSLTLIEWFGVRWEFIDSYDRAFPAKVANLNRRKCLQMSSAALKRLFSMDHKDLVDKFRTEYEKTKRTFPEYSAPYAC